jgi:uncharacterized membrane protein YedE/YeeE
MNSGFRNLLDRRDATRFKAYFLAIAVQMLVLPVLQSFGLVKITVPAFYPVGATLGGFIFGMAMNWGGGCAAGVWYKMGAGNLGAFIAIIGLCLGYVATEAGVLQTPRLFIQSIGAEQTSEAMTLGSLISLPSWMVSVPLAVILIFFLCRSLREASAQSWSWIKTGFVVGGVGVIAWLASSLSGRYFGMAVMPGSKDIFALLSMGGWSALSWDLFFVLGLPLGGFLSVVRDNKFTWSTLSGSKALAGAAVWRLAAGGFVLGASASLAGGCTVGHGLTGMPLLSLGSIAFTIFAILGAWAGVLMEKRRKASSANHRK